MNILIIGINYAPENAGIAVYTSGFAEYLVTRGHNVTVICAPPHFPQWEVSQPHSAWQFRTSLESGVTVIRCPTYIPKTQGAVRRVLHYLTFSLSSLAPALLHAKRSNSDLIFCVAPSMLSAITAIAAAKLVGARTWLHVQDLEIEAALATGILQEGWIARIARAIERSLLGRFDRVSSISKPMMAKLASKGVPNNRLTEFYNWCDLSEIVPLCRPSRYRNWWNIEEKFVILYSGSIGKKQGLEIIIEVADHFRDRKDLVFIVCGEGPNRRRLEEQASKFSNVRFYDLQPREKLNELLGLATIHFLPQLAEAADNVLPSKLTNMLASGRPIVAVAAPGTSLYDQIQTCGITSLPGSTQSLIESIRSLLDYPEKRIALGSAARRKAEASLGHNEILGVINEQLPRVERSGFHSPQCTSASRICR